MNKKVLKRKAKFIVDPIRKIKNDFHYRRVSQYARYHDGLDVINDTILYESRDGNSMTDSPFAIFKYLLENPEFKDFQHIWSIQSMEVLEPVISKYKEYPNVRFVERNSTEYLKCLATSKYLINNSTFQSFFTPKNDQIYINTWHGTPLKLMGFDIPGNPAHSQNVLRNFLSTSYLLSPNRHTTEMFTKSYKLDGLYEGTIIEEGYPRIDMTLNTNTKQYKEYLRSLGLTIQEEKQTILYAPTWKGKNVSKAKNDTLQIIADMDYLRSRVGDSYNILIKVHPFLFKAASQLPELKDILVPDYVDPNELLSVIDILITDYSSIFFDYLVTNKPIIFYTWDADEYDQERGQYIRKENLPGPIVYTSEELANTIIDIEHIKEEYKEAYDKSRIEFTSYDDGHVTERVVNYIFKKSTESVNTFSDFAGQKKKILIYPGGMKNNGITSSFINLMSNIDFTKYDVSCFMGYPRSKEVLNNINKVNKNVRFIFKPGYPLFKVHEIYQDKFIHNRGERGRLGKALYPEVAYKREHKRLFGHTHFDYVIDFSGYSLYWAKFLLAADADMKMCYMHNDLLSDSEREIKGKRPHRINLRGLFSVYHRFNKLVSVSKGTMELNRKNLIEYADYDKFDYILNSINPDKILHSAALNNSAEKIEEIAETSVAFKSKAIIIEENNKLVWNTLPIYLHARQYPAEQVTKGAEISISRKAECGDLVLYKFSMDNRLVGWIEENKVELLPDSIIYENEMNKLAKIVQPNGNDIWSMPYAIEGTYKVSSSRDYKGIIVHVDKVATTEHSTYSRMSINGEIIGWIDNSALSILGDYSIEKEMSSQEVRHIERKRKKLLSKNYKQHSAFIDNIGNRTLYERNITGLYARIQDAEEHTIWSKAYPNYKIKRVGPANQYEGEIVRLVKMNRTHKGTYYLFNINGKNIGWLDRNAFEIIEDNLLIKETVVSKLGEIKLLDDEFIWDKPFGLEGAQIINDNLASYEGMQVEVNKEAVTLEGIYYHTVLNGAELGWIHSQAIQVKEERGLVVKNEFIPYPQRTDINFVNMGRLSPEKAQDNLIKAFGQFHEKNPNSKLFILGQGPLEEDLTNLIAELGLNDSVYLLGQQENPFQFLNRCDCFILSSHYEGQPMVLLEAMTLGMDIIATDIVANRTVLEGGKYGLLVENSIEGLKEGMEQVAGKKGERVGAKFDAYQYNNFAMESFYAQLNAEHEQEHEQVYDISG